MKERKRGTLKSGRSGKKVKSRKQAIAIGLSKARQGREGAEKEKEVDVECGSDSCCADATRRYIRQVVSGSGHQRSVALSPNGRTTTRRLHVEVATL